MTCSTECSKNVNGVYVIGDGSGQGNCPNAGEFCYATGTCDGIYCFKINFHNNEKHCFKNIRVYYSFTTPLLNI